MHNFFEIILQWYKENARNLPWRNTTNPYFIWISEIILQQTRVAQGTEYYFTFIKKFPTIDDLAKAKEEEILKIWQGLGYYSRARNLHKAAKIIKTTWQGQFPNDYNGILSLPGVGKYTAGAISSIAFNLPNAAIDGNVQRVCSRILSIQIPIESKEAEKQIEQFLNPQLQIVEKRGDFNQSLIELGATICLPKPKCEQCPINKYCGAYKDKTQELFPVKMKKTKPEDTFIHYLAFKNPSSNFIYKRNEQGIWANLYELPSTEVKKKQYNTLDISMFSNELEFKNKLKIVDEIEIKHQLTHKTIYAKFWIIKEELTIIVVSKKLKPINLGKKIKYPMSKLMEKFLEEYKTKNYDK